MSLADSGWTLDDIERIMVEGTEEDAWYWSKSERPGVSHEVYLMLEDDPPIVLVPDWALGNKMEIARFIAASPAMVADLLEEVRRLQQRLAEVDP